MVVTYELMVVVKPTVDVTDPKEQRLLVEKLVGKDGPVVKTITSLGKKALAYVQKKQTEGHYLVVTLEGVTIKTSDLEKRVRMDDTVLSFLLTRSA